MKKQKFKIPVFTLKQRKAILALAFFVLLIQVGYFMFLKYKSPNPSLLTESDKAWLLQQIQLDSLQHSDSVTTNKIYPFNPNFITDFKGYQLGMSLEEIDRLYQFRKLNKFVNSAKEFQIVTQVSDSLLFVIQPYFKFPDWTQNKTSLNKKEGNKGYNSNSLTKETVILKELNNATASDFQIVNGIGEVLSQRIIDERDKYNAFVAWEQVEAVYGIKPEVVRNMQKLFIISDISKINKIDINSASIQEITKVPFIKYTIAKDIVIYRSKYGDFKSMTDLHNVLNFPVDKANIIQSYLIFK